MPRRIKYLTYNVPEGMRVEPGDLVLIPLRSMKIRGAVLSTKKVQQSKSEQKLATKLKNILSVLERGYYSSTALEVLTETANELLQSPATLLYSAIPSPPKRAQTQLRVQTEALSPKINVSELPYVQHAIKTINKSKSSFIEVLDLSLTTAILSAAIKQTMEPRLILTPHTLDGLAISRALRSSGQVAFLDSKMTPVQRALVVSAWNNGKIQTLVSTRMGALTCYSKAKTIFVVRAHSFEHAQYDRNPRYDARDIAWKAHKKLGAKIVLLDVIPRLTDIDRCESVLQLPGCSRNVPTLVDLSHELRRGYQTYLTEPLLTSIKSTLALNKSVLLLFNKKGMKDAFRERGIGNIDVENSLKKLFAKTQIQRIEKNASNALKMKSAPLIILATQYYLESIIPPFDPPKFGLVADLSADMGLSRPIVNAIEQVSVRLFELQGLATRLNSKLLFQCFDKELIARLINNHMGILEEDLELRKQFEFPPFGYLFRISYRGNEQPKLVLENLKEWLENKASFVKISGPFERKKSYIELRTGLTKVENLRKVLFELTDDYIIEINPER